MISNKRLSNIILSDKYNSLIFKTVGNTDIYLVGGYIRDIIRNINSKDRDYIICGEDLSIIKKIRSSVKGTLIKFKKGGILRIATKDGLTFDFSRPQGTLLEDLSKRDFTLNAIAWSPRKGIIDVFNGIDDLKEKRIRVIKKENFLEDPLRMLRAYRFASEIKGKIEKDTRNYIKKFSYHINKVSSERITLEFFYLLNLNNSSMYLKMALNDGLLSNILFLNNNKLKKVIKRISLFEKLYFRRLPKFIKVKLKNNFSQNLTYKGLLCLEMFLCNETNTNYKEHNLRLSNNIKKRLKIINEGMKIKIIRKNLFNLFNKLNESSIDLLIIRNKFKYYPDYLRYKKIWTDGIISSKEIISYSKIKSGKRIGEIIKEVKRAQFERKIKNKDDAIKLIINL